MNHMKLYIKLCKRARERTHSSLLHEKHHVFPESMFGKNRFTVNLTIREHYIAHLLLIRLVVKRYGKDHPFYLKSLKAIFVMTVNGKGKTYSRTYEAFRKDYVNAMRGRNWGLSIEEKRELMTTDNPMHRECIRSKVSETVKKRWSEGCYSNAFTQERNDKIRSSKLGNNNPMYGKSEASAHLNVSNYTCEYCNITTTKGNYVRWHGSKCKKLHITT